MKMQNAFKKYKALTPKSPKVTLNHESSHIRYETWKGMVCFANEADLQSNDMLRMLHGDRKS